MVRTIRKAYRIACIAIGKRRVRRIILIACLGVCALAYKNNFDIVKTFHELVYALGNV
ncbi:hypothetical protein [Clostridium porci]|uniref:hypothetical protein n=1 Tax=Clostridium porci TaxID=2605778 RepID=UPI0012B275B2|nr:hypothetical protein [Clostridium porci]